MFRTAAIALICFVPGVRADDAKATQPFNGSTLSGWKFKGNAERSKWTVGYAAVDAANPRQLGVKKEGDGAPQLINASTGVDIYTEQTFADCTIELELMVPKGSNSGIYVHGEYEVQILDSYGKEKVGPGDLGGLYGASAPKVNAARKPGEWQKFVIDFQAPKFENGKKVANAKFVKVVLNDQVIHENVEMKGPTPSGVTGKEAAEGSLMFQGDHGPVAFRNIKIAPRSRK
jgi:hypothetical protein